MFFKTGIKSENMGLQRYFSGAEGAGKIFFPLSTRYFDIVSFPRGGARFRPEGEEVGWKGLGQKVVW